MKKLLIVGDSLSMSRYQDGVSYDAMYSTLLARDLKDWLVINGSLRANTSRQIVSDSYREEYILPLRPDVVILQIGVVDCLPRLMSKFERNVLRVGQRVKGARYLARLYINFKSKRRLYFTKRRQIPFVDASEFKENLIKFRDALKEIDCRILVINIPHPGKRLSERTYGVAEAVCRYNRVIDQVFAETGHLIVDLYDMTRTAPGLLQEDGYHIREECHRLIYSDVCKAGLFDEMAK